MPKIKIGAHNISIELMSRKKMNELYLERTGTDPETCDEIIQGLFVSPDRIIVDKNYKGIYRIGIIFHEIVEAINYFYEFGMEHQNITVTGEVWIQILRDNWKYFEKMFTTVDADSK